MRDFVDSEAESMSSVVRHQLALLRVDLLNKVVELFEEPRIVELFRPNAGEDLAGKPASFVVRVEEFEVAAFDFDDQPHHFRKLELVPIVFGSAISEIADVDFAGLHPLAVVWTAHTNSGIDARSIWAFGPQAAQSGRRPTLNARNVISSAS